MTGAVVLCINKFVFEYCSLHLCRDISLTLRGIASFPGSNGGESRAWYALFAHVREFTNSVTWRGVVRRQYTGIVSGRTRNRLIFYFLQLERLSNQSRIAKLPAIFYPLGLW